MKQIEGFKVVKLTDDVIEQTGFSGKHKITLVGNPNPDPVERQKMINEIQMDINESVRKHNAKI